MTPDDEFHKALAFHEAKVLEQLTKQLRKRTDAVEPPPLIKIADALGLNDSVVGQVLGTSQQAAHHWRTGKRRITRRFAAPLIVFLWIALGTAKKQACVVLTDSEQRAALTDLASVEKSLRLESRRMLAGEGGIRRALDILRRVRPNPRQRDVMAYVRNSIRRL